MTNTIVYVHYNSIKVSLAVEEETKETVSQHVNNQQTVGTKVHAVHKVKNYLFSRKELVVLISLIVIVAVMPLSILLLMQGVRIIGRAQDINSVEPEKGTLAGSVIIGSDSNASNGQFVHFGVGAPVTFQPSPPYHATFYYMWYKNQATDGSWSGSYWNDLGNSPPTTWFSHYIPDQDGSSTTFDPAAQLYSANDYINFKWQAAKLAEAKQEVAIGSWWGQNGKEDSAFNNIINSFMGMTDNPYPNLRWSLYYECEGNASTVCDGTSNPTVAKIVSDLQYFQLHYTGSPYFLKVGGKPVIFVYADAADGGTTDTTCSDSSMVARWKQANTQIGNAFYVVLKVFSGYSTSACQPDSWHQYAPATRSGSHSTHDFYVSPGFWKDDGSAVALARDATAFENVVKSMVAANATWKLTETWNEWGEGSSVEPGFQSIVSGGTETIDPSGTPFGNLYIDILSRNLPVLEQGTGSNPQSTPTSAPTSTPTVPPVAGDPIIVASGDMACGVGSTGAACKQMETSNLFVGTSAVVNPDAVLPLGDNQYESGEIADWNAFYDPSWGRAISKTYPIHGNHEYIDPLGGAKGTFDYFEGKFGGPGNTSTRPGARDQGYYAFNLGQWRLYALNSNCSQAGGCGAGSPQDTWLRSDLAANPKQCVLAFFHHPLFTSGSRATPAVKPLIQALYDNNVDVILMGHEHNYERFAPMDPDGVLDTARGIRHFIVGTGGRNFTSFITIAPNSEVRNDSTFGVLKMTLHPTNFDFQFIPIAGSTFTDSGTNIGCH